MVKSETNQIFLILKANVTDTETHTIPILHKKNVFTVPKYPIETQYLHKFKIPHVKARDVYHLVRNHGILIDDTDLSYWYPEPTASNTLEFDSENAQKHVPYNADWLYQIAMEDEELVQEIAKIFENK